MKFLKIAIALSALTFSLSSCFKQSYDYPPDVAQYDPNLPCNVTIAQLTSMIFSSGSGTAHVFTGDSTIYGVVTADDRSGNFYHQIVIQDSTGGIVLGLQATYLYTNYPIGRKVYVSLKGLSIADYDGSPEIVFSTVTNSGSLTVTNIPSSLISTYVTPASYPHTVTPLVVTFAEMQHLGTSIINRLVEFDNMEFDTTALNLSYALPSNLAISTNRTVYDCPFTGSMTMYNSGYATFQPAIVPSGKGTLIGIYSVYNTSPQFMIRDTSDVQFTGTRTCP